MNKRFLLAAALLLALLLTGCGHTHQWQEATCTAPKTCPDCGETEGEPLGHTWQEASCTTAKTCTVCAETEGEPLPHDPVITAMYARSYEGTCRICGEAVSETMTEAAWTEVAKEAILGKWYGALIKNNGQYAYLRQRDGAAEWCMEFNADGTAHLMFGDAYDDTGTWEFSNLLSADSGTMVMVFTARMPDGPYTFSIQAFAEGNFAKFSEVTIPAGFTLMSHPDGTWVPFTGFYTRVKQY